MAPLDIEYFGRNADIANGASARRELAENASQPYKFAYARTALKYGLRVRGLVAGDSVLVPDFICESAIEPFDELGIEPLFYPIDPTLRPDWDAARLLIKPSAKALLVAHYFGQPQDICECLRFCEANGLDLIEDNAHGYGATYKGRLLGTFGKIGVSSPRKSFPISNGAYLYLADDVPIDLYELRLQPADSDTLLGKGKSLLRGLAPVAALLRYRRRLAEYRRRVRQSPPPYDSQDAFRSTRMPQDYGMDEANHVFLARQNLAEAADKRRAIYELWLGWAISHGLAPVFPRLSPGAAPLVFPAFAASRESRNDWFIRGHRAGIDMHSWPTLPRVIVEGNGGAMRSWERLVCFPIHQGMDERALESRLTRI